MSARKIAAVTTLAFAWFAFGLTRQAMAANAPASAEELISQHLDSIASPAVRAGLKNRVVQGPVEYRILVGGAGTLEGKAVLVSEGDKLQFMMKLQNNLYHGEQFIFDGNKDKVAFSTAQLSRSPVGNFVFVQDAVIREGLIGGTLSTAWPLLDLDGRKAKLSFEGLKKIDGEEVYALRYQPHKRSDLEITLYFDPQTYRHVETIYKYTTSESFANFAPSTEVGVPGTPASAGGSATPTNTRTGGTAETAAARQVPNRYVLQEKFSDFKTIDGVTLPTHEDMQFMQQLQNGRTILWDWDLKGLDIANNPGVSAANFEVK